MNQDYLDPINALHVPELADTTFAMDLLLRAKECAQYCCRINGVCITDVRTLLRKRVNARYCHASEITELMINKKWFHPYELSEQYKLDQLSANNTLMIGKMNLFPVETNKRYV